MRAADEYNSWYSLYFRDGGRVAAAAVGCVCVDYLTCRVCERILGQSFVAIERAVRKKQRTDPHVPVARVDAGPVQGLELGSHGVEGSDAVAISGTADQLGQGSSHPPSDGVEVSDAVAISGTADQLGPVSSHPPSDRVEGSDAVAISSTADGLGPVTHPSSHGVEEGFEAAISRMAARLGLAAAVAERAKEVFRKMEEASAWPQQHGPGRTKTKTKFQSKRPLAYAACLSIACRADGSAVTLRELARAVAEDGGAAGKKDIANLVAHIRGRLGKEEAGQAAGMVSISSYLRRYGALVGLRESDLAAALKAAGRLEDGVLDVRHSPDTVAAAVVCVALERAGAIKPGVKEVVAATGVSQTIYSVCRKLRCHVDLLFG
jgi:transcription initiation factor TFIIB